MARPELPTGTVTFLFTDVEGSTRLLQRARRGATPTSSPSTARALRDAFAAHGGVEVDTQGDAFFVAFARAADAVAAAAAAPRGARRRARSACAWASTPASRS